MRETEAKFNAWMCHNTGLHTIQHDFENMEMEHPVSGDHLRLETERRAIKNA